MSSRPAADGDVAGLLPRNFPRSCLLLLIAEQPSHGYDLLERLSHLGLDASDPGGLYRALRAMEREELVASHWETSATGPARRVYRLTGAGRRALDESAASLADTQTVVAAYLVRHTSLAPGREASNDGRTAPPGARSRAGSGRPDHASTRPAKSQPATLDA